MNLTLHFNFQQTWFSLMTQEKAFYKCGTTTSEGPLLGVVFCPSSLMRTLVTGDTFLLLTSIFLHTNFGRKLGSSRVVSDPEMNFDTP